MEHIRVRDSILRYIWQNCCRGMRFLFDVFTFHRSLDYAYSVYAGGPTVQFCYWSFQAWNVFCVGQFCYYAYCLHYGHFDRFRVVQPFLYTMHIFHESNAKLIMMSVICLKLHTINILHLDLRVAYRNLKFFTDYNRLAKSLIEQRFTIIDCIVEFRTRSQWSDKLKQVAPLLREHFQDPYIKQRDRIQLLALFKKLELNFFLTMLTLFTNLVVLNLLFFVLSDDQPGSVLRLGFWVRWRTLRFVFTATALIFVSTFFGVWSPWFLLHTTLFFLKTILWPWKNIENVLRRACMQAETMGDDRNCLSLLRLCLVKRRHFHAIFNALKAFDRVAMRNRVTFSAAAGLFGITIFAIYAMTQRLSAVTRIWFFPIIISAVAILVGALWNLYRASQSLYKPSKLFLRSQLLVFRKLHPVPARPSIEFALFQETSLPKKPFQFTFSTAGMVHPRALLKFGLFYVGFVLYIFVFIK